MGVGTPAFIRDPAFMRNPASIKSFMVDRLGE